MTRKHEIISLDPNKAWYEEIDGKPVFKKVSTESELRLLYFAQQFFLEKNATITVGKRIFSIKVPQVYDWNSTTSTITMSFCKGENLECLLCESSTRPFAIEILQLMFKFILTNHFFWYDFAPRNILVDENTIYLVDFEKGVDTKIPNLKKFLRNHVFEEYSSFLLKDERIFSADFVYSLYEGEKNIVIPLSKVKVKRFKAVAKELGFKHTLTLSQLLDVQKLIIHAEEPYVQGDEIVFPRIELVKMLEDKHTNPQVYETYAKVIVTKK